MGVYYILPEPRIKKSEDIFKIYQKIKNIHIPCMRNGGADPLIIADPGYGRRHAADAG